MPNATTRLEPYGNLVSGRKGISATRIADELDVPVGLIKRLAKPIGVMKMPYKSQFGVYDPVLVEQLREHPDVVKARKRREGRAGTGYAAAATRQDRCVDTLSAGHPDLEPLFDELVDRLWNPETEAALKGEALYRDFPAQLWQALAPKPVAESEAIEVIVDILWAMTKERTWKVTEHGDQAAPLTWTLWEQRAPVEGNQEMYENVFAAAIRHSWYSDAAESKFERRLKALARLESISTRQWPSCGS